MIRIPGFDHEPADRDVDAAGPLQDFGVVVEDDPEFGPAGGDVWGW